MDLVIELCKSTDAAADEHRVDGDESAMDVDRSYCLPKAIRSVKNDEAIISSLGGLFFYLRSLNLDTDLCRVGNFNLYDIHGAMNGSAARMILDGQTLAHIEVLQNTVGTDESTLLKLMNRAVTPSGKRLFKTWLCQPLCDAASINARLDVVDDLLRNTTFQEQFVKMSKGLLDLERVLSRIHAGSCKSSIFIKALSSLKSLDKLFKTLLLSTSSLRAPLLLDLLKKAPSNILDKVQAVEEMYTEDEGRLIPAEGGDEEYDNNATEIESIEGQLTSLMSKYSEQLGGVKLTYKDVGTKDIYQIEVPEAAKVKVPNDWRQMTKTKAVTRYYTPKSEKLIRQLKEAKETQTALRNAFQGKLVSSRCTDQVVSLTGCHQYAIFSKDYPVYLSAVRLLAELDCLLCLAKTSASLPEPFCRPEILDSARAFVDFRELRHPCLLMSDVDFIPNDIQLGSGQGEGENFLLLTGANMAGKSTL